MTERPGRHARKPDIIGGTGLGAEEAVHLPAKAYHQTASHVPSRSIVHVHID